ncbi:MAG: DNA glycosylase [Peptoniphilaceae bacterium]|nr:DNA glycosylase [Peptoniphilaceae bacterium]
MVTIADDFSLEKTVDSGQAFRCEKLDDKTYRFISAAHVLEIEERAPTQYALSVTSDEWVSYWADYFDLNRQYRPIREKAQAEGGFLGEAARFGAGIRILRQDPFEMLLTFILSQRKNIPAIIQSVRRMADVYGEPAPGAPGLRFFPTPKALAGVTEAEYRALGMGYRAPYLVDAVSRVLDGRLNLSKLQDADDATLITALMQVKGVGIKVANCIALYGYGRMTAAPVDVWIQRAIDQYFDGKNVFLQFGESAGILQQYVFYAMRRMPREE